jgi:hypothetical protein
MGRSSSSKRPLGPLKLPPMEVRPVKRYKMNLDKVQDSLARKAYAERKRKQESSRGKRRAVALYKGHYAGKFRRPSKKVKKVKWPCICKDERTTSASSTECAYIVHGTHPTRYVMRMIAMSMIHKYFEQNGIWIQNWTANAGLHTGVGTVATINLTVVAEYQQRAESSSDPQYLTILTIVGTPSYLELADSLADGLVNLCTTVTEDLMVTKIQWKSNGTGSTGTNMAFKLWDASEIRIDIYGKSMLNIQNRTTGGEGPGTGSKETTSIFANPLHGKHYLVKGFGARVKNLGVGVLSTSDQLVPSTLTGEVGIGSNATSFGAQAQDILKQPPLPNYFQNCIGSSYIRLEPGAIKQSTAYKTVSKTLNQWYRILHLQLQNVTTVGAIRQYGRTPIGLTRMIAMEKVANMGSTNPVVLAGERDAVYMSKLTFRKRRFTAPTNDQL